jgi:hypothetical protein
MPPPKPPIVNRHRVELARAERHVYIGVAFSVASFVGLRVAMDVYSGASIRLGLEITALVAVVTGSLLVFLPDGARGVLWYLIGIPLQ